MHPSFENLGINSWQHVRLFLPDSETVNVGTVKPVYSDHLWATNKWSQQGGGLFTEVKINCTSTIGTQPSGLYREVVSGCRWFFRQVSL